MALPVITVDDFIGWVEIKTNEFKATRLQEYIDLFLEDYLRRIVGAGAFNAIRDQTRQKWTDILNGVDYVDSEGFKRYFVGLTRPLAYFIYFEFIRDNFVPTQPGNVMNQFENSDKLPGLQDLNLATSRYNRAVYQINDNFYDLLEVYRELKQLITSSVDNADNTYTLSIPSTKYLEVGDSVEIDGAAYELTAVVTDTSITINAGQSGLDFLGKEIIWKPFEEVRFHKLEPVGI